MEGNNRYVRGREPRNTVLPAIDVVSPDLCTQTFEKLLGEYRDSVAVVLSERGCIV